MKIKVGLLILMVAMLGQSLSFAQEKTVVQLAVPEFARDLFTDDYLARFEAENPDIDVVLASPNLQSPNAFSVDDYEVYIEDVQEYVSGADVLFLDSFSASVEATRAGYFLDLAPLVSADPTIAVEDFFPTAWRAYQWDNGIWALPVGVTPYLIVYRPDKLDEAGVPYPNEGWTIADFANAIRNMAELDADGNVISPNFFTFDYSQVALFLSLTGESLVDESQLPSVPTLNKPALEAILREWAVLRDDGYVGGDYEINFDNLALWTDSPFALLPIGNIGNDQPNQGSQFPNGRTPLDVSGIAISSGTTNPEAAYRLAVWLTRQIDVSARFFGTTPARQSLLGLESETPLPFFNADFTPEQQALFQQSLQNGIPFSEMRFFRYFSDAINRVVNDQIDPLVALQDAESKAVQNLNAASQQREDTSVFVATPIPQGNLAGGEIALTISFSTSLSGFPNADEWQAVLDEFVANDPEVGQIIQVNPIAITAEDYAEQTDCFFQQQNQVPEINLQTILNLDPFMDADPNFNRDAFIAGVLPQLQRDNRTWAYPVAIQPYILRFHSDEFIQRGVIPPDFGWTIDQFNDTLRQLKSLPTDDAPFVPQGNGEYILMLTAAYGGLPIDFTTTPYTLNFTDPANVDAMRQVLDLAKDGYIEYQELANFSGGVFNTGEVLRLIFPQTASPFVFNQGDSTEPDPYHVTTYPTGNTFTAVAYEIATAYISATSQNPEACYRLISAIAQRPELPQAMPARVADLNHPSVVAALGQTAIDGYQTVLNQINTPNSIIITPPTSSVQGSLSIIWLFRAFDNYVLHDADLLTELETAQVTTEGYLGCIANLPPYDPAQYDDLFGFLRETANCATLVDPTLQPIFDAILGAE